jgi:hypothetical protein
MCELVQWQSPMNTCTGLFVVMSPRFLFYCNVMPRDIIGSVYTPVKPCLALNLCHSVSCIPASHVNMLVLFNVFYNSFLGGLRFDIQQASPQQLNHLQ